MSLPSVERRGAARLRSRRPFPRAVGVRVFALGFLCAAIPVRSSHAGICDPDSAAVGATAPAAAPPKQYHYVFVVDTSASMMGHGDGKGRVIFPRVKDEIRRFVDRVPSGSRVTFQPFDQGPGPAATFVVPDERPKLDAYLAALEARGRNTYLYASLLELFRRLPHDPSVATVVFLFTDGNDNDPGPLTMEDVTRTYNIRRGPYDWFYYFFLGLDIPPEVEQAVKDKPGWFLMAVPPNQVPRLISMNVVPTALDLGNLFDNPQVQRELGLQFDSDAPPPVRARVVAPELEAHGSSLQVEPKTLLGGGKKTLQLSLLNPQQLPPGEYQAVLCLESTESTAALRPVPVPTRFRYQPGGSYRILALHNVQSLTLRQGETAQLHFRLEGDQWATRPVEIFPPATVPEGLGVKLNGATGPVQVLPGSEVRVEVTNESLFSSKPASFALGVGLPAGASGPSSIEIPPVVPVVPWWRRLLDWWWLWLLLLLLLLLLLRRWWLARRPWAECQFENKDCKAFRATLRGVHPVDLGSALGVREITGLIVKPNPGGRPVITDKPPDLQLDANSWTIQQGEPVEWGETLNVSRNGNNLGTLTLSQVGTAKAKGRQRGSSDDEH